MTDDGWQRLDPRMMLIHPVREVVRFLPPLIALFVAGVASGGGRPWQLVGILVPVALGLYRYFTTSYRIAGGRVELKRGLVGRHVTSTQLDRVRTVDLTATAIHRVLGLTTLRIGTGTGASGEDSDLELDGLPTARAEELRKELLRRSTVLEEPVPGEAAAPPPPVVELDPAWVRYAPLTTSGLVATAGILGVAGQILGNADLSVELDRAPWPGLPGWTAVLLGLVVLLALVGTLSVAGYLVTNWGFALTRSSGAWHLRRGLLTTRETSLDEERVAGVSMGEPLGLRLAGGARLTAIVTGLDSDHPGSSVLVPPAPVPVVTRVAGTVLGTSAPPTAALTGHGPAATRRRYTRALGTALALGAAVAAGLVALGAPWWAFVPLLVLPLAAVLLAADRARALGHALVEGHVVARSGSLARRRDHLQAAHVIGWNLRATWFQRRVGLTSLIATTAGGRQSVTLPDVPEPLAVGLADETLPHVVRQFLV
ncbi:PH domain-containing protein [Nocardioides sp. cx-173]|uniref:PH domain-containing protein n=1 Tax=Nocardioides sp. cx-173 TaxID=2898796 RepID=UPI001E4A7C76|nr:PH domain-containing protein [Nocardioides sp. cx-173]MCD4525276.1 PH domain-containing protein [Nocardioides sp. cx-173]UGB40922.1 PH domain-containing protein [Nocardioides sp. cx-173]